MADWSSLFSLLIIELEMTSSANLLKRPTESRLAPSPPRKKRRITRSSLRTADMAYELAEATINFDQLALNRDTMAAEEESLQKRLREMDSELRKLSW